MNWEIGWPNFHWSRSAADTGEATPDEIAEYVYRRAGDKSIVLLHDRVWQTASAMSQMLRGLRNRNFFFATVEELLRMNGVALEPNQSYRDGTGPMLPE